MPRKIRIVTVCSNGMQGKGRVALNRFSDLLDDFIALEPDLVCMPEGFAENYAGDPVYTKEVFSVLCDKAIKLNTNLIAGSSECIDSKMYNLAWVIDRKGRLVGRYHKYHPVVSEIEERGIMPGSDVPVFELDFGRVGVAICFDIGWPDLWKTYSDKGAELVVWPSAYDGGFPLQVYAWLHSYYVVSSVRGNHSKIIDKTGRILKSTSVWQDWICATIDLEKEVFHIDDQYDKLHRIQRRLGHGVTIESLSEENIFTIESNDDAWPVSRIKEEFGLVSCRDYYKNQGETQARYRVK